MQEKLFINKQIYCRLLRKLREVAKPYLAKFHQQTINYALQTADIELSLSLLGASFPRKMGYI